MAPSEIQDFGWLLAWVFPGSAYDCTTASVSRACSASTTLNMIGSRFYDSIFVILLSRINIVVNSGKNLVDGRGSTTFNT